MTDPISVLARVARRAKLLREAQRANHARRTGYNLSRVIAAEKDLDTALCDADPFLEGETIERLTGNGMASELFARVVHFTGARELLLERLGEAGSVFSETPRDVLEELADGRRVLVYQPCTVTAVRK